MGQAVIKKEDIIDGDKFVIDANYVHTDNNLTDELVSTIGSALQSETDPTVPSWAKEPTKPTYTASEVGAAPSVHNHSGQSINPDNVILSKQYTDLTMVDLAVGAVFYNVDQLCWLLKLSDVNYYNFGEELPMLSKNGDTSTHTEGTAVYISSGSGQLAVVKRTSSTIGKCNALATADVLNTGNGRGYYCFFGAVRQFPYTNVKKSTDNENTWIDGAELFLCSESGKYSTTKEDAPAKSTKIGTITNRSGANITVMFQPENSVSIDDLSDVDGTDTTIADTDVILKKDTAGLWKKITWANVMLLLQTYVSSIYATILTVSGKKYFHGVESIGTVTFDNSTHIVTLATIKYWYKGVSYTGTNVTCDLDSFITLAAGDTYFVYFDAALGVLKASESFWDLHETVPIILIWWNGSAGAVQKEWHGYRRDIDWHINAHLTIGARYYNGLTLTAPTTANDAVLTIEAGTLFDEDLALNILQQTSCRIVYKNASGVYIWANSALPYAGTSGQPQYLDTDTNTLTNVSSAKYVNMWVYGSNDADRPIYIIPSHVATDYNTVALARAEVQPSLSGLTITPEMKLLYRFIYKGDGQFQESADYRNSSSLPAGGTAATTASNVSVVPSGNISATNVQLAIEELDSEKEAVSNKQNSLTHDGSGLKYPTVDAVNLRSIFSGSYLTKTIGVGENLTWGGGSFNTSATRVTFRGIAPISNIDTRVLVTVASGYKAGILYFESNKWLLTDLLQGFSWTTGTSNWVYSGALSANYITLGVSKVGDAAITPAEALAAVTEFKMYGRDVDETTKTLIDVYKTLPYVLSDSYYSGIKIDPGARHNFNYSFLLNVNTTGDISLTGTNSPQGIAIYGDYLFQLYNSGICAIVNLLTNTLVSIFAFPNTNSSHHANSARFSDVWYSGNTEFPLLYVSECFGNKDCFVYSITSTGATLVQTLKFAGSGYTSSSACDWNLDPETGHIYLFGNTLSGGDVDNRILIKKIITPIISEGAIVTLDDSDVIDSFHNDDITIYQGNYIVNDKIICPHGYGLLDSGIIVIDLIKKRTISRLITTSIIGIEPESCAVYNGDLLVSFISSGGRLYKFTF